MSWENIIEELKSRYKLVCRKCGSENVVIDVVSEPLVCDSGYVPGSISVGCNDCKQNDMLGET